MALTAKEKSTAIALLDVEISPTQVVGGNGRYTQIPVRNADVKHKVSMHVYLAPPPIGIGFKRFVELDDSSGDTFKYAHNSNATHYPHDEWLNPEK